MARIKTVWLPKMSAKEFYAFCVDHHACRGGLNGIKGLTLAKFWGACERSDYMRWFARRREELSDSNGQELIEKGFEIYCDTEALKNADWKAEAAFLRKHIKVRT